MHWGGGADRLTFLIIELPIGELVPNHFETCLPGIQMSKTYFELLWNQGLITGIINYRPTGKPAVDKGKCSLPYSGNTMCFSEIKVKG